MSWGVEQGREDLKATEFNEKELGIKGFKTVDLLSGFALANGGNLDVYFLSMDPDLKKWLLGGEIKALAKTDFCVYRDALLGKHTSCWYNSFSKMYVGDYANWVFSQPDKDWRVSSYKAVFGTLHGRDKTNLTANVKDGLTDSWWAVYFWFFSTLKRRGGIVLSSPA